MFPFFVLFQVLLASPTKQGKKQQIITIKSTPSGTSQQGILLAIKHGLFDVFSSKVEIYVLLFDSRNNFKNRLCIALI